jgi:hypothetical protein
MPSTTSIQGAPYLAQLEPPDISGISLALATWAETRVVMRFASAAVRNTVLIAPTKGMLCYLLDSGRYQTYDGSMWQWLQPRPLHTEQVSSPNFATTGSTVPFTNAQWPALTFTIPPSGQFWASISANISNINTPTSTVFATWLATTGTVTPMVNQALSAAGTRVFGTKRVLCTAAAGSSVTLTPQWFISSGDSTTAVIGDGMLAVEPIA